METRRRNWILLALLFVAGFTLGVLYFAPLATCPWCDGEIKHFGGRKRHCDGHSEGCDGSGWISYPRRWESLEMVNAGR